MFLIGSGAALIEFVIFAVSAALAVVVISRVIRGLTCSRHRPSGRPRRGSRLPELSRGSWVCGKTDCRAENPEHARYCKRCGLQRVPTDFGE